MGFPYTVRPSGRNLVVTFPIYYDFEGFYTDTPGRNRQRSVRTLRLTRQ